MNDLPLSLQKIIQASAEISSTPANEIIRHISYLHSVFCQVGLPRSQVAGSEFMRRNGNVWLNIHSGYKDEGNGPIAQPIPYGPMARLSLAYITSYAVRYKCREIPLGDSASKFLKSLNLSIEGRRFKTLRQQMNSLASCTMQMGYKGFVYNGHPIEGFSAWLKNKTESDSQYALWPGLIILSEPFYDSLLKSPVPLDIRSLDALKSSALAMDIYTWLAHRLHRIQNEEGQFIAWTALQKQFGVEYTGKNHVKDFKDEFKKQFIKALTVYPNACINIEDGGLLLKKSEPPIPFKPTMLEISN